MADNSRQANAVEVHIPGNIPLRSRHEEVVAANFMARANTWEEKRYLTEEGQRQKLMLHFHGQHQTLKHSGMEAYRDAVESEADYMLSPADVLRRYRSKRTDLSQIDPSPAAVAERRKNAQEYYVQLLNNGITSSPSAPSAGSSQLPPPSILPSVPNAPLSSAVLPPGASTQSHDSAALPLPPVGVPRSIQVSPDDFPSTLSMLLNTQSEVDRQAEALSSFALYIPGAPDLKRTITRIFAAPKLREEISKHEWERRERKYADEQARQQQALVVQVSRERELLQKDIDRFRS